jgi:hypothetical protein
MWKKTGSDVCVCSKLFLPKGWSRWACQAVPIADLSKKLGLKDLVRRGCLVMLLVVDGGESESESESAGVVVVGSGVGSGLGVGVGLGEGTDSARE